MYQNKMIDHRNKMLTGREKHRPVKVNRRPTDCAAIMAKFDPPIPLLSYHEEIILEQEMIKSQKPGPLGRWIDRAQMQVLDDMLATAQKDFADILQKQTRADAFLAELADDHSPELVRVRLQAAVQARADEIIRQGVTDDPNRAYALARAWFAQRVG
jgi:hypothetical protein